MIFRQIEEGVTGAEPSISLGRWREHQLNPKTTDKAAIDWYMCYDTSLLHIFLRSSTGPLLEYWHSDCFAARAGVNSKWIGIVQFQFNSGIGAAIGIERFGMNWIGIERYWIESELEFKNLELKDLELNKKELSIWHFTDSWKYCCAGSDV